MQMPTADELARRWTRRSEGRFLCAEVLPPSPHSERLTHVLFAALAGNGDGKLSKAEVDDAEKVLLAKFDIDEDDCITPFELAPSLLTDPPPETASARRMLAVVLLHPGQTREDRLAALVTGGLDRESARAVLARSPDQEITVRFGSSRADRQQFRVGGMILDVTTESRESSDTSVAARIKLARSGNLSGEALRDYLVHYRRASEGLVSLAVVAQPRGWFELLDANGDGRLGIRELRQAWQRLADANARAAGVLALPDRRSPAVQLTFVRGVGRPRGIPLHHREMNCPLRGPAWFRAMDRNGDGVISPREWLGRPEDFKKIDRDGDGLISPEEAERFPDPPQTEKRPS
jgi:hypothetical protein